METPIHTHIDIKVVARKPATIDHSTGQARAQTAGNPFGNDKLKTALFDESPAIPMFTLYDNVGIGHRKPSTASSNNRRLLSHASRVYQIPIVQKNEKHLMKTLGSGMIIKDGKLASGNGNSLGERRVKK